MATPNRVRDCMTTNVITLSPDTEILQAVHTLIENDIAGAPVVDANGALVGMLTERDCMRMPLDAGYHGEYGEQVSEYMSEGVEVLDADESVVKAMQQFLDKRYHRYPVVSDGRLVGVISRRDVLRALEDLW